MEDLIQIFRPRQDNDNHHNVMTVMLNNDNDGKLADTIYIICWSVYEPTLYAIFSNIYFFKYWNNDGDIQKIRKNNFGSILLRPGDTFLIKIT